MNQTGRVKENGSGRAIIIVDVQNDFVEGGALACEGGNQVARNIVKHLQENEGRYDRIVTTQDWHIDVEQHFAKWGAHCVADTMGAELVPVLGDYMATVEEGKHVSVLKGHYSDGYSGFGIDTIIAPTGTYLPGLAASGLSEILFRAGVRHVTVVGIALDYCVQATALDAFLLKGFGVEVLFDLTASVHPDSGEKAKKTLRHLMELSGTVTADHPELLDRMLTGVHRGAKY